jgi:hypothetical protein
MIKRGLILFSKFTKEDQLLMLSRLEELGLSKLLDYRPLFLNSGGPYEANPFEAAQGAEVLINFMTPAAKLEPILKANPGVGGSTHAAPAWRT